MMAKIIKNTSFRKCVNYVSRPEKDNPDGTPCDEWRLLATEGVPTYGGREEMIATFEDNLSLKPDTEKPCGHFSLNFLAEDAPLINDKIMVEIAAKYMERMGYHDTPYIVVRHFDKPHPHFHIVTSRINNHAEVISDSNDFDRNKDVCLALTKEYGLHISEGKQKTKVENLKGDEKIRYEIFHVVDDAYNDKSIFSFEQFKARLKANGVDVEYKYRHGSNEIQGLWYIRKGKRFAASKIDRRFSYGNINKHLAQNKQKQSHPKSNYLYGDGTIKPLSKIMGVELSPQQQKDYVAGRSIKLDVYMDGYTCSVYLKFDPQTLKPRTSLTDPDAISQPKTVASESISLGHTQSESPIEKQGFAGGGGLTWPEYKAAHPELPPHIALQRFKAIKRGQDPNANLGGGMHM